MIDAPPSVIGADGIATLVAMAEASPTGCFVEIGVYQGGSAWHLARIAREQARVLHLFDTFTGIPYKDPEDKEHSVGDFSNTSLDAVRKVIPDAIFHVGVFPESMSVGWPCSPIAFAHVDCDQYRGTKAAIDSLWPLLVENGIMLFDDYGETSGCTKAVNEGFEAGMIRRTPQGKAYVVKDSCHG